MYFVPGIHQVLAFPPNARLCTVGEPFKRWVGCAAFGRGGRQSFWRCACAASLSFCSLHCTLCNALCRSSLACLPCAFMIVLMGQTMTSTFLVPSQLALAGTLRGFRAAALYSCLVCARHYAWFLVASERNGPSSNLDVLSEGPTVAQGEASIARSRAKEACDTLAFLSGARAQL